MKMQIAVRLALVLLGCPIALNPVYAGLFKAPLLHPDTAVYDHATGLRLLRIH